MDFRTPDAGFDGIHQGTIQTVFVVLVLVPQGIETDEGTFLLLDSCQNPASLGIQHANDLSHQLAAPFRPAQDLGGFEFEGLTLKVAERREAGNHHSTLAGKRPAGSEQERRNSSSGRISIWRSSMTTSRGIGSRQTRRLRAARGRNWCSARAKEQILSSGTGVFVVTSMARVRPPCRNTKSTSR